MPMSEGKASQAESAASTQPLGKEQQEASVCAVQRCRESHSVNREIERDCACQQVSVATSAFTESKLGSQLITERIKEMEQDEEFGSYYSNPTIVAAGQW